MNQMNRNVIPILHGSPLFDGLELKPADALLALIGAFRADQRAQKLDLGVGVYRTEAGETPIMRAVKEAERRLVEKQTTKSYLGPEGDIGFVEALRPIVFGAEDFGPRLSGLQTPGGTGALRLASELIAAARPGARIHVGTPTWPNHLPIFKAAGLDVTSYQHFDVVRQELTFDRFTKALDLADPGDVVLLHACCHNPTGADLTLDQWATIAGLVRQRGLVPLIDFAYQGLGQGLDEDAAGVRLLLDAVGEGLVAHSCDKNFGLYRDRVGALFALSQSTAKADVIQSNLLSLARANWSMPPAHGGTVVRTILEDPELTADWKAELSKMASRIRGVRSCLADADPSLAGLAAQQGLFSTLSIGAEEVARLRAEHGIYMPSSGRINVAGLTQATVPAFVRALASLN